MKINENRRDRDEVASLTYLDLFTYKLQLSKYPDNKPLYLDKIIPIKVAVAVGKKAIKNGFLSLV